VEILDFAEIICYFAKSLVCCDLFKVCLRKTLFVGVIHEVGALEKRLPVLFDKFFIDDWSIESPRFSLDG